jgi:hypothetical protein
MQILENKLSSLNYMVRAFNTEVEKCYPKGLGVEIKNFLWSRDCQYIAHDFLHSHANFVIIFYSTQFVIQKQNESIIRQIIKLSSVYCGVDHRSGQELSFIAI